MSASKRKNEVPGKIGYCDYPQEIRRFLPEYAGEPPAAAPVASVEECLSSPVVTTANFTADPQLEDALRAAWRRRFGEAGQDAPKMPALAPREKETLLLAAQGMSNKQIAQRLKLSPITVAKALSRVYSKLESRNRAEAVRKFLTSRE